jgi:hypothetical protein
MKKWSLGLFAAALVAFLPMSSGASLLAYYPCDDVFASGGWNYTSQVGGSWDNALIAQSGGAPYLSVLNDPERGSVLRMGATWAYIRIGTYNPLATTGEFTAMMWTKYNESGGAAFAPLIMKRGSAFSATHWQFTTVDGTAQLKIEDDNQSVVAANNTAQYNIWVNYAFSGKILDPVNQPNRMTVELFVNGQSVKTGFLDLDPADAGQFIHIGNTYSDKTHAQVGALFDDIRFYDQALSSDQILAIIPEPSAIALVGLGGLMLLIRRR